MNEWLADWIFLMKRTFLYCRIATKEKDEKVIATRRRDMMRLLGELNVVGFSVHPDKLFDCLKSIVSEEVKNFAFD